MKTTYIISTKGTAAAKGLKLEGRDITKEALFIALQKVDPNFTPAKLEELFKALAGGK